MLRGSSYMFPSLAARHTTLRPALLLTQRRYKSFYGLDKDGNPIVDRLSKKLWGLWNKPVTEDEQVKQYVPEVLEQAHAKRLDLAANPRDHAVVVGDTLVKLIAEQGTVSEVRKQLDRFLTALQISGDVIPEKSLMYLLHPGLISPGELPNTLVTDFHANLGRFVKLLEIGNNKNTTEDDDDVAAPMIDCGKDQPKDAYLVKMMCALAVSNTHEAQYRPALECCKIAHDVTNDPNRKAGVLALMSGVYNHLKRYDEAYEAAQKAIEASGGQNSQAFLQGATALLRSGKDAEAVALLEQGMASITDQRKELLSSVHSKVSAKVAAAIESDKNKPQLES
eukprot:PhF_6_TR5497/c0_g1_i3/m.7770